VTRLQVNREGHDIHLLLTRSASLRMTVNLEQGREV